MNDCVAAPDFAWSLKLIKVSEILFNWLSEELDLDNQSVSIVNAVKI